MIRNERQRRVTTAERDRLRTELDHLDTADAPEWVIAASRASIDAQLLDLEAEIDEYVLLQNTTSATATVVADLADLPRALVRARIASGLTQRGLAERIGIKEQQVQRYESNDYAGANIARLQEVMAALDVSFNGEMTLPASAGNGATMRRNLQELGLSKETLSRRFFGGTASVSPPSGWMTAAAKAARIFKTDVSEVIAGRIPQVAAAGAFRASSVANQHRLNGYARYAEYLSQVLLEACPIEYTPLPPITELRDQLGDSLAKDPLDTLVRLCWQHGIPVLPLHDPGAFYGACWHFRGRPVIALKNAFHSPDRWAFLLAHELDHASSPTESAVLEADLPVREWRVQPAEQAADSFAAELLLGDSAEAMTRVAVERAHGQVSRLKAIVPLVAAAGNVSVGVFADHVASRVQSTSVNWWPVANGLHANEQDAWSVARNVLFEFVDLSRLDFLDREILIDGIGL